MVLNSLEVDPGRVWKGVWRWYHESMLDCCKPLDQVQQTGINVEQFVCLARCNRLIVDKHYADNDNVEDVDKFRQQLRESVRSENKVFVVSYDRAVLSQTGSGHFSTIGGYHVKSDKALILDVARFKYPPHWVDVSLLWKAMRTCDPDTNRPRGYLLLQLPPNAKPMLLFQIVLNCPALSELYTSVKNFIEAAPANNISTDNDPSAISAALLKLFAERVSQKTVDFRDGLDITIDGRLCCNCSLSADHLNVVQSDVLNELTSLHEYKYLRDALKLEPKVALPFASVFLAFPYEQFKGASAQMLAEHSRSTLGQLTEIARNEIMQLKTQLSVVTSEYAEEACQTCHSGKSCA